MITDPGNPIGLADPTCVGVVEVIVCTGRDPYASPAMGVPIRRRFRTPDGRWRSTCCMRGDEVAVANAVSQTCRKWIAELASDDGEAVPSEPDADPFPALAPGGEAS